jgi:hypothetical protein
MARKPSEIVAVKVRMRQDLRQQIERLAKRRGESVNNEMIRLLECAMLAEQAGVGGINGVLRAVQTPVAVTVAETLKQLGLEAPKAS